MIILGQVSGTKNGREGDCYRLKEINEKKTNKMLRVRPYLDLI